MNGPVDQNLSITDFSDPSKPSSQPDHSSSPSQKGSSSKQQCHASNATSNIAVYTISLNQYYNNSHLAHPLFLHNVQGKA